tara:strand:- start:12292 stop:13125 length:834 start_codon:yes stop_codon:yes gene_type:complete
LKLSEEDDAMPEDSPDRPRPLLRTLKILEHVAKQPEAVSLTRMSQDLDLPKSSLLGVLRTLTEHHYLEKYGGRYALGPSAHRLAAIVLPGFSLVRMARPMLRELADRSGETSLLAVLDWETSNLVYIDKCESYQVVRYTVPVGTTRPLYCTAAGLVLLAWQPKALVERYLDRIMEGPEPLDPPLRLDDFWALLEKTRRDMVSTTQGNYVPEVAGIAAPILDRDGGILGALALGIPIERSKRGLSRLTKMTHDVAQELSAYYGRGSSGPDDSAQDRSP